MEVVNTPRFEKYKARKRDNWTVDRLAYRLFTVFTAWPAIGISFVFFVVLMGVFGHEMPGDWSNLDLGLIGVFFIWLQLWVIAMLNKGSGFAVSLGWLFFRVTSAKNRESFRDMA